MFGSGHSSLVAYPPHSTCRTFSRGWRLLKWVGGPMRPDIWNVVIRLQHEAPTGDRPPRRVILRNNAGLKTEGHAASVAAGCWTVSSSARTRR
jgi:hypothetical protein